MECTLHQYICGVNDEVARVTEYSKYSERYDDIKCRPEY